MIGDRYIIEYIDIVKSYRLIDTTKKEFNDGRIILYSNKEFLIEYKKQLLSRYEQLQLDLFT